MNNDPLISVLMTAYNREQYIADAIESVISSNYSNWELIITDDCSVDNTFQIAQSYEFLDSRIRLYRNEINLGDYPNRNKAASYAKGELILNVDSDDMIFKETMLQCVNIFTKFKQASLGVFYPGNYKPYKLSPEESIVTHFFKSPFLLMGPGGMVVRTSYFREIGGFPTNYGPANDGYFNLKAASKTDTVLIPFPLSYYRRHNGQEVNNKYSYLYNNYCYLKDALDKLNFCLNDKQKVFLKNKNRRRFLVNVIKFQIATWNWSKTIEALRRAGFSWKDAFYGVFH
jgi:glycosyltransferase involved in cell wall biosynthesis